MEGNSQYEELRQNLARLETEYHSDKKLIKGSAAVAIALVGTFFGITLSQIGSKVEDAMSTQAVNEAEGLAMEAANAAREAEEEVVRARESAKAALDEIKNSEAWLFGLRDFRQVAVADSSTTTAKCPEGKRVVAGFKLHWTDDLNMPGLEGEGDKKSQSRFGICETGKNECRIEGLNTRGNDEVRIWVVCADI